jgi:hypothetical protein
MLPAANPPLVGRQQASGLYYQPVLLRQSVVKRNNSARIMANLGIETMNRC